MERSLISYVARSAKKKKFRVWAENVGAHRRGKMLLDHRLREATRFSSHVKDLLADLDDVVMESKSACSREH
jgi:hypothetical protein